MFIYFFGLFIFLLIYFSVYCYIFNNIIILFVSHIIQFIHFSIVFRYFFFLVRQEEPAEPEVHIDYELIKYTKLQKVIDKLVNSNELNLLEDSITAMTNNVKRLAEMRKNISVSQKKKNDGVRLATDVRSFVAKNCFQNLVTPLGLVTIET